jgi:phosphoribosylanthranilate isomerase
LLVKVCGVCRPTDAALVAAAGADYLGVILSPGFSRSRGGAEAAAIYAAAGPLARVGVFVDATRAEMEAAVAGLGLQVLQLHGAETPALAASLRREGLEVWKALRPGTGESLLARVEVYAEVVDAVLLDGGRGTGTRFDWDAIADVRGRLPSGLRLVVAGGLTPENVIGAVRALHPDAVDVSSGVESAPGQKSPEAVRAFVAAARAVGNGRAAGSTHKES